MRVKLGLVGVHGRMGREIALVAPAAGAEVIGGCGRSGDGAGGFTDAATLAAACDVLVDFSVPAALPHTLAAAVTATTPVLVGTTGLGPAELAAIAAASGHVAVLQAANTSLGVALLRRLVTQAAHALGPDWDISISEMHHRHKRDAPSGTALLLGAAAASGRAGGDRPDAGGTTDAGADMIHYASLRGGSVAGDHQVIFAGDGERLELGHRAEGRAVFAHGAVRAARWLHGRASGLYTMDDVLDRA